jgi:hypothetical protein
MSILSSAIQSAISDGVDLEHAMYKCINPRSVYEIETIGVQGIIASTGKEVFE